MNETNINDLINENEDCKPYATECYNLQLLISYYCKDTKIVKIEYSKNGNRTIWFSMNKENVKILKEIFIHKITIPSDIFNIAKQKRKELISEYNAKIKNND